MIREFLVHVLRVPPEPHVPPGAKLVRTFRAARNFFNYQRILWLLGQVGTLAGLIGAMAGLQAISKEEGILLRLWTILEVLGWMAFLMQLPLTYLVLRIDYEMRWYIVTDRSLRIREGVWKVREKTMTFANLQNITVRQGPIQRLLRIADVEVRTAGGGAKRNEQKGQVHDDLHLGYFRGVDNAGEIRDLILDRVRRHRDSGLGDPDEPEPVPDAAEAARELLAEVRSLRAALTVTN